MTPLTWGVVLVGGLGLHFAHLALGVYDPGGPTGWHKVVVQGEYWLATFGWFLVVLGWLL